jgi:DNA-directed RNA polymerase specialized sigma24 family protein
MGALSEAIHRLQEDDSAAQERVFHHFYHKLLDKTRRLLSPQVARRVSGSDILSQALARTMEAARQGQLRSNTSQEFEKLLVHITRRTAQEEARRNKAAKRSVDREVPGGDAAATLDRDPTPEEKVKFRDLLEFLLEDLDDERRKILSLRAGGMTPAEIQDEFRRDDPDRQPPAAWMIEDVIRAACAKLRRHFPEDAPGAR